MCAEKFSARPTSQGSKILRTEFIRESVLGWAENFLTSSHTETNKYAKDFIFTS